ncbi:MAG: THUMP domain-containing protein, partial [Gemmatimonadales bacterium]|nr:THUMP domain-containing protein [Gemmatimonadales bacterium]
MSLPPLLPCFAATAIGLESLARDELTALGLLPSEIEPGGVPFTTDAAGLDLAGEQPQRRQFVPGQRLEADGGGGEAGEER